MGCNSSTSVSAPLPNAVNAEKGIASSGSNQNQRCSEEQAVPTKMTFGSDMDMGRTPNTEKRMLSSNTLASAEKCIGYACRKGRKPGGRAPPNQDSWCVHRVPQGVTAYGVFDGHGEKGHLISDYVKQVLPRSVVQSVQSCEPSDADAQVGKVQACFQQVQKSLYAKPHLAVQQSGTTATLVLHDRENSRLLVSHVGDSTAVVVKSKVGTAHEMEGIALTRDHKLTLPDEKERIERHGRIMFDGYCHRVNKKHGVGPGLNMSRSLGDGVAHRLCGVSDEPEVTQYKLSSQDQALLVCSDGIWEVISPQEAADVVKDYGPWQSMDAARKLADMAVARWMAGTQGQMMDDITVVLAFLQPSPCGLDRADTGSTAVPATISPSYVDKANKLTEILRHSSWSESTEDDDIEHGNL
mmetsp:Transcript_98461/g.301208  ORF Transcript_98461/g.301208 Transcript_98461/m.301208 type:complete len:411 (-) Transcript_98461:91-1323(-)